jgi:NAD(P)-dependent dehydrogenase (short-subunit alcohol dehydrogenase family)
MNVNFHGVKRVVDSFGSLLTAGGDSPGRIVNVGSGAGPGYVKNCSPEMQALLCNPPSSWDQLLEWAGPSQDGIHGFGGSADSMKGYGLSKALLHSYTMLLAKEQPQWATSVCSPGFINTKLTAGWGASKAPEEGTAAIRQLLFEPTRGNGWYFGSDGVRSPYHFMRNPGEPEYDGVFHPPTNA